MKDYQIVQWLRQLKPESEEQRRAIESAERAFYRSLNLTPNDDVNDFLEAYDRTDLINKPSGELYEEYLQYCNDFDADEISHSLFTKMVKQKYKLRVIVSKVNKKSVRVFKA